MRGVDSPEGALPVLDAVEQRVIGVLLEKERTVPTTYPMTLNALRTACNQTSSREPVVDFDDATVVDAIDRLKFRGLARMVHASHGSRMVKYRQVLDERLEVSSAERAVLTVLLLRGPNTPGELKARTERLHRFEDRADVEACLAASAARTPPLVRQLDRHPGQQDQRWIHLLGPVDVAEPGAHRFAPATEPPGQATEAVLAEGPVARDVQVRAAYDRAAVAYADRLVDELDHKPFDRWLLERVADLAGGGPVADAGCGPGHIAFHLATAGADVRGFDLSPAMVGEARRRFEEVPFEVADLTALPAPPQGRWSAMVAWYSLVHLSASELAPALALLTADLVPGGVVALAVHLGDEARHFTELWGREVDLTFALHHPDRVLAAVAAAGLVDVEWYRRSPLPGVEAETERLYVLAHRPM